MALAAYCTGFATLTSVSFEGSASYKILLSLPFLALTFCLLAIYHDSVVHHLHLYVKRVDKDGWDNSQERAKYSKSIFRWSYFAAQLLAFVGTGFLALWLNRDALLSEEFYMVWWLDLIMVVLTFVNLIGIRIWRVIKD